MHGYYLFVVRLAASAKYRVRVVMSLLFLPSLFSSTPLQAQDPLEQLTLLNRTGMTAQAFALANELLPQWEGEPAFDLQYGVAAVDSGFFSEGIFALERVTMNQPENNYARLELARAYFAAREDERAKVEFERVLAANPPQEVRTNIRPYLDTISARESSRRAVWRGSVDMRTGYDSNINASTDDDLSSLLGLPPGTLTTATPQEDSFASLAGVLTYSKPLTSSSDFSFSSNLNHRENSSGDLPQTSAGLSVGYSLRQGASAYSLALQGNHFRLENEAYRDMLGLSVSWKYTASPQTSMTLFAQASDLSYDTSQGKDSLLFTSGMSIQHVFTAKYRPSLTLGITKGFEDAKNDNAPGALQNTERDTIGANMALGLSLSSDVQLITSIRAQRSEYAEELVIPPVLREDINLSANIAVNWRVADDWIIGLNATASENDSTAKFTSYEREQISLSARYLLR